MLPPPLLLVPSKPYALHNNFISALPFLKKVVLLAALPKFMMGHLVAQKSQAKA